MRIQNTGGNYTVKLNLLFCNQTRKVNASELLAGYGTCFRAGLGTQTKEESITDAGMLQVHDKKIIKKLCILS
jgi:hypothetical protein